MKNRYEHLVPLGFPERLCLEIEERGFEDMAIGRIVTEHRDRYLVHDGTQVLDSELLGNLRFTADSREDLPAVGDWVVISEYDLGKALIHGLLSRHSALKRKVAGKKTDVQILAANVDVALILMAVDHDFNINRLERYLTIITSSDINPVLVLSKTDLISQKELSNLVNLVEGRHPNLNMFWISNVSKNGLDQLKTIFQEGQTYSLLGSSGVGKSTLINNLLGKDYMITSEISDYNAKGRHTTTHRELIILPTGVIVIDNPGMREIGISNADVDHDVFQQIESLITRCKFNDCTHTSEEGCAIIEALNNRELDLAQFQNFEKIQREKVRMESSIAEKRRKDKALGKLYKRIQQEKKSRKY